MPVPQLTPPGHLDLHVVVVAATPAILALLGGTVAVIAGGGRAARILGWFCTLSGLGLLALFLRPGGVAASYSYPLGHGWIRVGPWQILAALLAGLWSATVWRPAHAEQRPFGWGVRTAVALIMPISLIGIGAVAPDLDPQPRGEAQRWNGRLMRLVAILLMSLCGGLALLLQQGSADLFAGDWSARICMATACAVAACSGSPRWAVPMVLAALGALMPLASP